MRDSILTGLRQNTRLRGRQSTAALKVPGVDALPSGVSFNAAASIPTITVASGSHILTDWQFADIFIQVNSGAALGLRHCQISVSANSAQWAVVNYLSGSTYLGMEWCTAIGPGEPCAINPIIKTVVGVNSGGNTRNNYIYGWPSDVLWLPVGAVGAAPPICDFNYIRYTTNLPAGTVAYNASTTYQAGDGCTINGFYKVATQTTTGNAPPSDHTSNTWWQESTPHLDPINIVGGNGGGIIGRANVIECDNSALLIGVANTLFRISQSDHVGPIGDVLWEHCASPRAEGIGSYPVDIIPNGSTTLGMVTIRYCKVTPNQNNDLVYPRAEQAGHVQIGDVVRYSDGASVDTTTGVTAYTPPADTSGDDDVEIVWHDRNPVNSGAAGVQVQSVSQASFLRDQFTAAARAWLLTRPGEKLLIGMVTQNGTGWPETLSDSDSIRYWIDDKAVADRVKEGGPVGVGLMSWYASTAQYANDYAGLLHQLISGKTTAGATVTVPGTLTHGATSVTVNHLFSELASPNTVWMIHGPHRAEISADMSNNQTLLAGGVEYVMQRRELSRLSLRSVFPSVHAPNVKVLGVDALNYEMGRDNGSGGWTDQTHPGLTNDGSMRYFALKSLTAAHALGLVGWAIPEIDNAYWPPGGAYAEFWASKGAITTTRLARGLAALPATYPHWTTVFGFEINGAPAQNVQIVAGRIRVYPNSGAFNASTVITFGKGGATGNLQYTSNQPDQVNRTWMNYPIVDVGQAYVEGIALRPMPAAGVMASTL